MCQISFFTQKKKKCISPDGNFDHRKNEKGLKAEILVFLFR